MRALLYIVAVGMTALLSGVVLSGPAHADELYGTTFSLLGPGPAQTTPEIMQVKSDVSIYGGVGPYGFGYGRRGFYGGVYPGGTYFGPYGGYGYGDGEGYYTEGRKTCVWNGYEYSCYKTY